MRILTIIGTRPEIIRLCDWEVDILYTGQHYDFSMGERFLANRGQRTITYLPADIDHEDLRVLTNEIKIAILPTGKPDVILVHGDTRSALAGAIAAQDFHIVLAHTEAGVRSTHETVEQAIRKQIDKMAQYNFCPVPQAVENLKKEGITKGVYFTGDTLYDTFLRERERCAYVFVTLHRRENIEDENRLRFLIESLKEYGEVIFPVHPHTEKMMEKFGVLLPDNVTKLPPLDHAQTLGYIRDARLVLTDSGGIEREAFWSGVPVKTARPDTEWSGYTGAFGDGHAGNRIRTILETQQPYRRM